MNAQPKQRNDAWYANRVGRITASRVGAILGLSKYRNRDDVMRDMVREALGAPSEFTGNEATRYGELHEADALDAYEQRYGTIIEPSGLVVDSLYDWLAASPDGLVGEHGLVECKCPYRSRYTTPSAEYVAQMQLQMACTGRDWCDFVIWREGEPIIVERVECDLDWIPRNLGNLQNFMDEYRETIADPAKAAPYLADKERDDADWRIAVEAWRHAKREAEDYASLEKQLRAELIALAPQGAKGCGVSLARVETEGRVDYKRAITQMLPDVDLSAFKGKPSISYRITESKQ
jgi:putative phage-type endonuclease